MQIVWNIINYLCFYGLWCLCATAGCEKRGEWVVLIVIAYLMFHLSVVSSSPKRETILLMALTLLGAMNESILAMVGVVSYARAYFGIAWWTLSLWACFATTFWHTLSWLGSPLWRASVLGALAAPVCYAWLSRVGVISFPLGVFPAMAAISMVWAGVLPLAFVVSRRIQHFREDV